MNDEVQSHFFPAEIWRPTAQSLKILGKKGDET